MNVSLFSDQYCVRKLNEEDAEDVCRLCSENPLYYQYCPPFVSKQSIIQDMNALPPGKKMSDKHYVGFCNQEKLIAVLDLIEAYPDESTAFIGFFMVDKFLQNSGTGSRIIHDLCRYLSETGFTAVRLGWVKNNPQAEHFWHKNGFCETGTEYHTENYSVVIAERRI